MFDDENMPKNQPRKLKDLTPLSIKELNDYIDNLKQELIRAEEEIKKKELYLASADNFFKS